MKTKKQPKTEFFRKLLEVPWTQRLKQFRPEGIQLERPGGLEASRILGQEISTNGTIYPEKGG